MKYIISGEDYNIKWVIFFLASVVQILFIISIIFDSFSFKYNFVST